MIIELAARSGKSYRTKKPERAAAALRFLHFTGMKNPFLKQRYHFRDSGKKQKFGIPFPT
jgi:hypothetical protein